MTSPRHVPLDRAPTGAATARALEAATGLAAARGAAQVLRAAVEAACSLTSSRYGLAGSCDDEAVVSEEWYEDGGAGWTARRSRWPRAAGGLGAACDAGGPQELAAADAGDAFGAAAPSHLAAVSIAADALPPGLLVVAREEAYSRHDLDTLAALGRLTALRLAEATAERRCITEYCATQADIADRLQRKLLPQRPPVLEGLDVAFSYRSASAGVLSGGDFLDFYSRSLGTLAFVIGDVAGKGVDAMAVTFVTKYVLRAAVQGGQLSWPTHPGEALQELRTALLEQPDFRADTERFVTVLFGTLTVARGLLHLASAGHPAPFIVRAGEVERPLLLTEPAIGVELGAALSPYPEEVVELQRGDVVVLFTDGLSELRDAHGGFFEDVLADVLRECHDLPAAEVVDRLQRAGEEFSTRAPSDDLAILCLHLTGTPEVH